MMNINPIKTEVEYLAYLKEVEGLMSAERGSPEGERLDALVTVIEQYEQGFFRSRSNHADLEQFQAILQRSDGQPPQVGDTQ